MDVSPSADSTFLVLGQRKLLFSESRQQLYELNDTAAYIWCSLQEGDTVDRIVETLADRGLARSQGAKYVKTVISDWLRMALVHPVLPASTPTRSLGRELAVALPNSSVVLRTDDESVFHSVASVFGHLRGPEAAVLEPIDIVPRGGAFEIAQGGQSLDLCAGDEVVASLKAYLTQKVLERSGQNIVLHAACLVDDNRSLLLMGRPGAGKTALTLALTSSGLGYAGDDVTLLAPNGQALGVPFAAAVKTGAWGLVSRYVPDFHTLPVQRRADRKRVRYVTPSTVRDQALRPIGWFVFLRRRSGQRAALEEVEPGQVLTRLIEQAYTPAGRLTTGGVHVLSSAVQKARAFDLIYSDLDEAVGLIKSMCHGS
jgi:hypothetical protein